MAAAIILFFRNFLTTTSEKSKPLLVYGFDCKHKVLLPRIFENLKGEISFVGFFMRTDLTHLTDADLARFNFSKARFFLCKILKTHLQYFPENIVDANAILDHKSIEYADGVFV